MTETSHEGPPELGFRLRTVSNHVSHALARRFASMNIGLAEWACLRLLHGDAKISHSRIAEAMGMTGSGITRLADRLIERSLVVRSADVGDRRVQLLALTDSGVAVLEKLTKLADEVDGDCFSTLSDNDRRTLDRLLRSAAERLVVPAGPLR